MKYNINLNDSEGKSHSISVSPHGSIFLKHPNTDSSIGISPYHLFEFVFKVIGNTRLDGTTIYPEDPDFVDKYSILT